MCSIIEVNAVYSHTRARKGKPTPQLAFWCKLALKMHNNTIDMKGMNVDGVFLNGDEE
jgi:hypothetical protein